MKERFEQSYTLELVDELNCGPFEARGFGEFNAPISNIIIGNPDGISICVGVDKKFN